MSVEQTTFIKSLDIMMDGIFVLQMFYKHNNNVDQNIKISKLIDSQKLLLQSIYNNIAKEMIQQLELNSDSIMLLTQSKNIIDAIEDSITGVQKNIGLKKTLAQLSQVYISLLNNKVISLSKMESSFLQVKNLEILECLNQT